MTSPIKIFIAAGESSGDIHAAGLLKELQKLNDNLLVSGLGGENLKSLGADLLYRVRDLAALGFWEVAGKIGFYLKVKKDCVKHFRENRPDLVILVDYPGMNLKLAKAAHKLNIPVVYFILPQVWAWKEKRVRALKKYCDMLISILPFEKDFFAKHDTQVEYVGHPLLDLIPLSDPLSNPKEAVDLAPEEKLVVLMPGSRTQEIEKNLPVMLDALKLVRLRHNDIKAIIIKAPDIDTDAYKKYLDDDYKSYISLQHKDKYRIIEASDAALVASGTATLETAICRTPGIVVYRISTLTYLLARMFVKVKQIALANLVAGEVVFPELIQHNANPRRIAADLENLLTDVHRRMQIKEFLARIRGELEPHGAYRNAAGLISDKFLR